MNLSIVLAALAIGVSAVTLRKWRKDGRFCASQRTRGRRRRHDEHSLAHLWHKEMPSLKKHAVAYTRVSSRDQVVDLGVQQQKVKKYCSEQFPSFGAISDLGSGFNYRNPGPTRLLKMIHTRSVDCVVINHKDKLLRFGSEIIFSVSEAKGIAATILEEAPDKSFEMELTTDGIELMTVFSARFYGRRSHRNKAAVAA